MVTFIYIEVSFKAKLKFLDVTSRNQNFVLFHIAIWHWKRWTGRIFRKNCFEKLKFPIFRQIIFSTNHYLPVNTAHLLQILYLCVFCKQIILVKNPEPNHSKWPPYVKPQWSSINDRSLFVIMFYFVFLAESIYGCITTVFIDVITYFRIRFLAHFCILCNFKSGLECF